MEILSNDNFKTQSYPLVWRDVELRLSHEQHWAAHDVPVLTVSSCRGRSSGFDRIASDQIVLDPTLQLVRLLPQSGSDRRRLRFTVQHGKKRSRFQAPDEFTLVTWTAAIASAIGRAEKAALVAKGTWVNDVATKKSAIEHTAACRLAGLHLGTGALKAPVGALNDVYITQKIDLTDETVPADYRSGSDESAETCSDTTLGNLFDAVQHDCGLSWSTANDEYAASSLEDDDMSFDNLFDAFQHDCGLTCSTASDADAISSLDDGDMSFFNLFEAAQHDCGLTSSTVSDTKAAVSSLDDSDMNFDNLFDAVQHDCGLTCNTASDAEAAVSRLDDGDMNFGNLFDAVQHGCGLPCNTASNAEAAISRLDDGDMNFDNLFDAVQHDCGLTCSTASDAEAAVSRLKTMMFNTLLDSVECMTQHADSTIFETVAGDKVLFNALENETINDSANELIE